jgi:hypothetical protein
MKTTWIWTFDAHHAVAQNYSQPFVTVYLYLSAVENQLIDLVLKITHTSRPYHAHKNTVHDADTSWNR